MPDRNRALNDRLLRDDGAAAAAGAADVKHNAANAHGRANGNGHGNTTATAARKPSAGKETDPLVPHANGSGSSSGGGGGVEESAWWQFVHAFSFLLGGVLFCLGTLTYFWPDWETGAYLGGWLYTVGSCGFLAVDVLEFFTFTTVSPWLRCNIAFSGSGSTCYVVGSIGFIPSVYAVTDRVGVLGFIIGSALIGTSQLWKTHRIARTATLALASAARGGDRASASATGDAAVSDRSVAVAINRNADGNDSRAAVDDAADAAADADVETQCLAIGSSKDAWTAAGVELSAGLGAWCFFVGTLLYDHIGGDSAHPWWNTIIGIWLVGSWCFTQGGLFLAYRHAVMKVV